MGAARALIRSDEGAHLDDVLPDLLPDEGLDRGLGWHLALGVVRRRASVDAVLRPWLRQPLADLDPPVRAVLRVGAFEVLHGRAAKYAAVDQAVEVAKAIGAGRAAGLVNAVMRRVDPSTPLDRADALDHPSWLIARWDARYGVEATDAWCRANLEPPPLFAVAPDDATALAAAWREEGIEASAVHLGGAAVPGVLRLPDGVGRVDELPGYDAGAFWIQDAASAWMTDLVPDDGGVVLDACAAPGGKTFRLATRGHEVIAVDQSSARLERLTGSVMRLRLTADVRAHDWSRGPLRGLSEVDTVLVDAPCTALGTVRRNPEVKWRRGPFDPAAAAGAQRGILEAASTHVRAGGALVYVVCSPEPEEGPEVIAAFTAAHPEFSVETTRCTAPPTQGEDAFWGARLRRR